MPEKTPTAPIWYEVPEVRQWLKNEDHDDFAKWLTYHFQKAFEKGWEMGFRTGLAKGKAEQ